MSRHVQSCWAWATCWVLLAAGCQPTQPFYLLDDKDLSHYVGTATDIEVPDVDSSGLAEVAHPDRPRSLMHAGAQDVWLLSLEEAVSLTLANSKVMRSLGGRVAVGNSGPSPEILLRNPAGVLTVYDPALVETDPRFGVESALAEFDAQLGVSTFWERNVNPRNVAGAFTGLFIPEFEQDLGEFRAVLSKVSASGTRYSLTKFVRYDQNNSPTREVISDWNVLLDAEARHPLLARGGVLYNRIAGPGGVPGQFNGVALARISTDIRLADFEAGVRNLVQEVEQAYWNLYFAYRNLAATRTGRDAAHSTLMRVQSLTEVGAQGGDEASLAQALEQYFLFRGQMESALTEVYRAESRLRYLMGLAATDHRLIKPADEPSVERHVFDWAEAHAEALCRSVELRQQKWRIKQRELELIAAKNLVLPRLDLVGRYRWEGLGDHLIYSDRTGVPGLTDSTAYESLTSGDFQSHRFGFELAMPLGFARELATVRHHQLLLVREKQRLADAELEVSHQMADALREYESLYVLTQTAFNRRVAAYRQLEAVMTQWEAGLTTIDVVLDAQRRLADAEIEYFRSLVNYNLAITNIHLRKNSLLERNNIHLAEGPWPDKAYFDAFRRARARDAGVYFEHGRSRPPVFSRGAYPQHVGPDGHQPEFALPETATDQTQSDSMQPQRNPLRQQPTPMPLPDGEELPAPQLNRVPGPRLSAPQRPAAQRFDWGELGLSGGSENAGRPRLASGEN